MRVLVVEDDYELGSIVTDGLSEVLIDAVVERSFDAAMARAVLGAYEVILLDVMIPGGNGFDFVRQLRLRGVQTPVLMLTALDSVDDRVRGFEAGADDYVTKPFSFPELVARVRALARRSPTPERKIVQVVDLTIDMLSHAVQRNGRELTLTAHEFTLLAFLAEHAGQDLSRRDIVSNVWDDNHISVRNVLDVLIKRLRRKIDDGHDVKLIHTIRGEGYRLGG
ncbi:MAG TPA: response regulator transcription factor [Gemmatimonadaceae bacterium]